MMCIDSKLQNFLHCINYCPILQALSEKKEEKEKSSLLNSIIIHAACNSDVTSYMLNAHLGSWCWFEIERMG